MSHPCFDEKTKTDCPRRHCGCALTCKEWKEYEEKHHEELRKRLVEAEANSIIVGSNVRLNTKYQKSTIANRARRTRRV